MFASEAADRRMRRAGALPAAVNAAGKNSLAHSDVMQTSMCDSTASLAEGWTPTHTFGDGMIL